MAREFDVDKRFSFLHSHIAREPHIYEVLSEIMNYQKNVIKTGSGHFATIDDLKASRNIKIPFTYSRNITIADLVDMVEKNYPEQMKSFVTFHFTVDPESRKLSIAETKEYTLLLSNDEYGNFHAERNKQSVGNFLTLISQFRLFNLTKLLRKAKERALLSQIIKSELGNNIFIFKNYLFDKQNNETAEEFCFHIQNYPQVKATINIEKIKNIISSHSLLINRKLKKFGILSNDFSDYNDTKLDYLLNILLGDILSSLSEAEQTEVKNFTSLRSCLLKVEKVIDPLITASNDIAAFVKESRIAQLETLASIFPELTEDKLLKWTSEHATQCKILFLKDDDDTAYLIDGEYLLPRFSELHDKILFHPEDLAKLSHSERKKMFFEFTILCNAGKNLLNSETMLKEVLVKEEDVKKLEQLIVEYEGYQKNISIASSIEKEERNLTKKRSILSVISDFLNTLFTFRKKDAMQPASKDEYSGVPPPASRTVIPGELKSILYRIKNSEGKIIPLSNYIELRPENDSNIEEIIDDIRKLNLKIVIPIFNARKALYPNRSQQYLISDVEYLLIKPEVLQSTESIREFTDSLAGEKLKDEKLPPTAIFNIEKYLINMHKQKKLSMNQKMKIKKMKL